jgi:hypothetical protein
VHGGDDPRGNRKCGAVTLEGVMRATALGGSPDKRTIGRNDNLLILRCDKINIIIYNHFKDCQDAVRAALPVDRARDGRRIGEG